MTLSLDATLWIESFLSVANRSLYFMLWNTFLAAIPWVISLWIFKGRGSSRRRVSWWIGFVIFIAFLPNAPYVLTDIIHPVRYIREGVAMPTIAAVLIPQFFLFILVGCELYTLALLNFGQYLRRQGWHRQILPMELVLHGLCSFGIYLGRFPRFNSWDLLTNPGSIARFIVYEMTKPEPIAVMVMMFVAIAVVYWPLKHVSLALKLYWRMSKKDALAVLENG